MAGTLSEGHEHLGKLRAGVVPDLLHRWKSECGAAISESSSRRLGVENVRARALSDATSKLAILQKL